MVVDEIDEKKKADGQTSDRGLRCVTTMIAAAAVLLRMLARLCVSSRPE